MASRPDTRQGDPAFSGDERLTHEPVVEERRASPLPSGEGLRRPVPWGVAIVAAGFVVAAVVAGAAAGWGYAIPFAVFAGLAVGFFLFHWMVGRHRTGDSEDPFPNVTFDKPPEEPDEPPARGERAAQSRRM